jgi:transposase
LLGPVRHDVSWQAKEQAGYDLASFQIDWQAQQATCPQGQVSSSWTARLDAFGTDIIEIHFSREGVSSLSGT